MAMMSGGAQRVRWMRVRINILDIFLVNVIFPLNPYGSQIRTQFIIRRDNVFIHEWPLQGSINDTPAIN